MIPEPKESRVLIYKLPEMVDEKPAKIKGVIHLRKLTIVERFKYVELLGYKDDEATGEMKFGSNKIQAAVKMIELSLPHYLHVDLVKDDGTEIKSVEDMQYDPDCDQILFDVSRLLMNGRPEKN